MNYSVAPRDYLDRAKHLLVSDRVENLPYAAFELRACVEARQAQYYDAFEWKRGQKIKSWKVSEISRKLHENWKYQKIAKITYHLPVGDWETYFTPITPGLAQAVNEDLGNILHALSEDVINSPMWWNVKLEKMVGIYRQAWVACKGQHLAMPLWDPQSRQMHPVEMAGADDELPYIEALSKIFVDRLSTSFSVEYLEEPPETWKCDL